MKLSYFLKLEVKKLDNYIIGSSKFDIDTPALLIDLEKMEYNIAKMADFFKGKKTNLRPHIKTHKSPVLAHKQIEAGAIGITCQKLGEAEVMTRAGIRDIFISNEIVGVQKIKRLVNLRKSTNIKVAIDNYENAKNISNAAREKGVKLGVLIELNIGMNRCGVSPGETALKLVQEINKLEGLEFLGLMGYEGHTVFIESYEKRECEAKKAIKLVNNTNKLFEKNGIRCKIVSCGGTGTYSITSSCPGVTEIEAGSYITMDTRYNTIEGIGGEFKQTLSVLTTVISKPTDDRAILDVGMKGISKEFGFPQIKSDKVKAELYKLSEEHGFVKLLDPSDKWLNVGEKIELIPSHGCTTINLHDKYYGIRDGIVEIVIPIEARGKFD